LIVPEAVQVTVVFHDAGNPALRNRAWTTDARTPSSLASGLDDALAGLAPEGVISPLAITNETAKVALRNRTAAA